MSGFAKLVAGFLLLLIVIAIFAYRGIGSISELFQENFNQSGITDPQNQYEIYCVENGGEWISEHQECEGIDESDCIEGGGEYNDCASACRHDPEAEACIEICVAVCKF